MIKKLLLPLPYIILLIVILSRLCISQDYFPLEIGNTWVYEILTSPGQYDTTRITEKTMRDDKVYLVFKSTFFYGERLLRRDSGNNVLEYMGQGIEDTLYKLEFHSGDSWKYSFYTATFGDTLSIAVHTAAGDFKKCIYFLYDSEEFFTSMTHYLAPDVGLIYLPSVPNFGMRLAWAQVNGVVYPESTGVLGGQDADPVASSLVLYQNYPNPFNSSTRIQFFIPSKISENIHPIYYRVMIDIYNILGQKINTLVDRDFAPGLYEIDWDGEDREGRLVSAGPYFYRLTMDVSSENKRMLLVK